MPEYEYKCKCNHQWSDVLSIEKRNDPLNIECPVCGLIGCIHRVFSDSANIISKGILDADKNMEKCGVLDNLNRIKSQHPEMKWKG